MANTTTNHTDKNAVESLVCRTQLEQLFKEEHSAKSVCNNEDQSKVSKAYATYFGDTGMQQLRFGKRYWECDANWAYFIHMISPFLIEQKQWWHLCTEGEEVELVLHCAAADTTWAQPEPMHFRKHSVKDVLKLLDSSYDRLVEHQGWSPMERDVLVGKFEGAPEPASDSEGSDNDDESSASEGLFGDSDSQKSSDDLSSESDDSEYEPLQEWGVEEESYTGDMDEGKTYAHGYGVLTRRLKESSTGQEKVTCYCGKLKEGAPSGYGEEACEATGEKWAGEWRLGQQHGLGERHYTGGAMFRGTFDGGKPEGAGTYLSANLNELAGLFTCDEGVLHRSHKGKAMWPADFAKQVDAALEKGHAAAIRAQSSAEAAEQAAQLQERTMRRLADEGMSQGPQERREVRELRMALAVGGITQQANTMLIDTYSAALAGEDVKQLEEAENRALFAVALAHGRLKSLIKEHERLTEGDYSKTSELLETTAAVDIAHKAFIMQTRLFGLKGLDIEACADLASAAVRHYHNALLADGMPNGERIGRIMQCAQVRLSAIRVDAQRRENIAKRGANAQGRAQDELREAYDRLSKPLKLKQKRAELKQIKKQQAALSKQLAAVEEEIAELEGEGEESEAEAGGNEAP